MSFPFPPPQGYPSGSASLPVKIATSTVTAGTTAETFSLGDAGTTSMYPISVPVPSGVTNIICVVGACSSANNTLTASPSGYADGALATTLFHYVSASFDQAIDAGDSLALGTAAITLGSQTASRTYDVAVFYQ